MDSEVKALQRMKLFVSSWYESQSLQEVALKNPGMDRQEASNLAADLRRNGVKLPKMKRVKPKSGKRLTPAEWHELRIWAIICEAKAKADKYRQVS